MASPRACVVGAGSSGIAAAKALADRGIEFDCFEKSDRVGGNWVLGNRNGMSSAYSTLHINTSRERMEYADYPMPRDYPDFPRHDQIARYFDDYVGHFGLRERIAFETGVEHVGARADGTWEVTLDTGERRSYDAVLVANGHHWDPRWPEPPFEGSFGGELIHSHEYRDPSQLQGKRVVVVGMGNSAMDIAVDSSYHGAATTLVARSGVHVVPKYILGKPLDAAIRPTRVPFQLMLLGLQSVLRVTVGPMERYGLPNPEHRLGRAHPTVSTRILDRLAHGAIAVKRGIAHLDGEHVVYTDGSRERADLIVCCTGYKISFPFFDEDFFAAPDNRLVLYRRIFAPGLAGLYFIGFVQPWGAIMPIAELQGRLVGDHLLGEYALPAPAEMRREMGRMLSREARRYMPSKRHTLQVDYSNYAVELEDERRAGVARAKARAFAPEVAAQAQLSEPAIAAEGTTRGGADAVLD